MPHSFEYDGSNFYPEAKEELPPNKPKPCGMQVSVTMSVDANHAEDMVTQRSQSGILIYVNESPISWYSKHQNTVESSTFGSEFIVL